MRTPRFHTFSTITQDSTLELEEGPSQHIARVLRMQTGDPLVLFDGSGAEYPATIVGVGKKRVVVHVGAASPVSRESGLFVHLGIGISRGERMDWIVQKATELGVACISPLFTERTEVKLNAERGDRKLRHWQNIAISACEQCERNVLPDIMPPRGIDRWLTETQAARKFVLHHRASDALDAGETPGSVAVLVGPEGGLSEQEIQRAEDHGFQPLRLGPRVLRTETAPVAAIAILQSIWGDMKPGL